MATRFYRPEPWFVTEAKYQPELNEFHETIFHLANGYMGVRATPEEGFTGSESYPATYLGSVYELFPSYGVHNVVNTREHLSVMTRSADAFGVSLTLGGERFDPLAGKVTKYRRRLDMRRGLLERRLTWCDTKGRETALTFKRFVSQANMHLGVVEVEVTPLNWSGTVKVETGVDAQRAEAQKVIYQKSNGTRGVILGLRTNVSKFETAIGVDVRIQGFAGKSTNQLHKTKSAISRQFSGRVKEGETLTVEKLVVITTSRDPGEKDEPAVRAQALLKESVAREVASLQAAHEAAWNQIWSDADVVIEGDKAAQQGIRYCIFSMHQTYRGFDPMVNISAKGLSGPGYGGLYWWDSEAYMIPFFLYSEPEKARKLLEYRIQTLDGARRKAAAYGFKGALTPWVTIWGDECSGDWEYGMIEQHVGTTVAHAMDLYLRVTQDEGLLWEGGLDVLIEGARFWHSRVNWSPKRKAYVINFVTGPDEYSVGVNNNTYTNAMAAHNLKVAASWVKRCRKQDPKRFAEVAKRLGFKSDELTGWAKVAKGMLILQDPKTGLIEQDDTYFDRDHFTRDQWDKNDRPVSKWNWYRMVRSQAMKQPDVLMLIHMLNDQYSLKEKRVNYVYYEPRCVHESSLSPCIHSIIANEVGLRDDAFDYYLMTARLDLDDVNGNARAGQHTASIAGSWLSVVTGFGGMRVSGSRLHFEPRLPDQWKRMEFKVVFRGCSMLVELLPGEAHFRHLAGKSTTFYVGENAYKLKSGGTVVVPTV